jgi:NADPH-dependent 2,4-dienoyl-CoA reductase/sulfur reductase-like enzyme
VSVATASRERSAAGSTGDDVKELRTDVAVIGGGLGACAAALAAARLGRRVVLTEETRSGDN